METLKQDIIYLNWKIIEAVEKNNFIEVSNIRLLMGIKIDELMKLYRYQYD